MITPIKIFGYTTAPSLSVQRILKPLPQVTLTSTSNYIHEKEGKSTIIYIS